MPCLQRQIDCPEGDELNDVCRNMVSVLNQPATQALVNPVGKFFGHSSPTNAGLAVSAAPGPTVGCWDISGAQFRLQTLLHGRKRPIRGRLCLPPVPDHELDTVLLHRHQAKPVADIGGDLFLVMIPDIGRQGMKPTHNGDLFFQPVGIRKIFQFWRGRFLCLRLFHRLFIHQLSSRKLPSHFLLFVRQSPFDIFESPGGIEPVSLRGDKQGFEPRINPDLGLRGVRFLPKEFLGLNHGDHDNPPMPLTPFDVDGLFFAPDLAVVTDFEFAKTRQMDSPLGDFGGGTILGEREAAVFLAMNPLRWRDVGSSFLQSLEKTLETLIDPNGDILPNLAMESAPAGIVLGIQRDRFVLLHPVKIDRLPPKPFLFLAPIPIVDPVLSQSISQAPAIIEIGMEFSCLCRGWLHTKPVRPCDQRMLGFSGSRVTTFGLQCIDGRHRRSCLQPCLRRNLGSTNAGGTGISGQEIFDGAERLTRLSAIATHWKRKALVVWIQRGEHDPASQPLYRWSRDGDRRFH